MRQGPSPMTQPGYSDVVIAIYQSALQPDLWSPTLELMSDYLGADSGMVLHLSAARDGDFIIHRRLREDLNQLFLQHYTKNPYASAFAHAPVGKALVTEALLERRALYRSAFYADILAPQGIAEIIAVRHSDLSRVGVGGILFNMSKPRADDAERAATRLDDLIPHLNRAIDFTLVTSRLGAGQRHLDQLLRTTADAVIVLDRHGSILKMTPPAEALLKQRDGLQTKKGDRLTVSAQTHEDSVALAASIKQALAVSRGEPQHLGGMLQIKRPSGRRPFLVEATPLLASALSPWSMADGGARVVVRIVDPQAPIDRQAKRLGLMMGLTTAETRVAALLASGLGFAETARELRVSLNTVKTHARRVFDKAGVRSSAALVRLVASVPAGPA